MLFWQTLEVLSKQPTFLGTVTGANGGGGDGTRILVVCEDGLLINDLRSSIFGGGGGPGGDANFVLFGEFGIVEG